MTWKSGNESTVRGYKFTYDGLDRVLNATYGETASISTNANRFSENVTGYDKNGNIKSLQRYGQTGASAYGLLDNLTFTLNGNQLSRVDDAVMASAYGGGFEFKDGVKQVGEYTYDANGNLTKDLNKGITDIQYNCLNLPSAVTFSDGSTITYVYAADGTKLRTVHKIGGATTTTDYCGNVVYENGAQKLLITEEGYITLSDNKYYYYLKDHQGNNRVVINQSGAVEETNHYYLFGGVFASSTSTQPYKYNSKEYDTKKGLNWYDYGARHYDAVLGRFMTVDPLAEKYYSESLYTYCYSNPINCIDPNGKDGIYIAFPDYKISTPIGKIGNLGHAGVLLIDNKTGVTKYYEYGRYDKEGKGVVRTFAVPNVKIGQDKKPTLESLNKTLSIISEQAGHAGRIEGAYIESDKFKEMKNYAESKRWKTEFIDVNENGIGGFKEVSFMINGQGAYSRLKYESGVHRVQRIPATESGGRIHTSTITVAIMPEAEEVDVQLDMNDCRFDVFRASGNGGQCVNTTDSAVRLTHIPTGIVISCQDEKSQLKNKDKAIKVLRARLYDLEQSKAHDAEAELRKSQIGTGDRAEKIHTYNFPQGRVTDHRIKLTLHRLDDILNGDLDEIIDSLTAADQAAKLSKLQEMER